MNTDHYEAVEFPRGNLVVKIVDGNRAHPEVVDECVTIEDAQTEAAEMNAKAWLAARPADVPVMEWHDDWEQRLLRILNKPWEVQDAA